MADTKITALTAISTVDPAVDVLPIVDVSDTTMAASGTTKKITSNQILGAGGTATLASATITGDLTVRTNKLVVTSTGVGVNYTSPAVALHLGTTGATNKLCINTAVTNAGDIQLRRGSFIGFSNAGDAANSEYMFANGGALEFGINSSTAMTLNSTGLGVGVASPAAKLDVYQATLGTAYFRGGYSARQLTLTATSDGSNDGAIHTFSIGSSAGQFLFANSGGTRLTIDSSGNVGVGVTPVAGNGAIQLSAGIGFPATQVASSDANTLDDYEEGTFTPGLTFGGASVGMVGSLFNGRYTKVGRTVAVNGIILLTAKGTSTGTALITGLPFTSSNGTGSFFAVSLRLSGISFTDAFQAYIANNSSVINLEQITNAGVDSLLTDTNFPVGLSVLIWNATYDV
jgi:hypothetical protein